jgi:hypothetical protein
MFMLKIDGEFYINCEGRFINCGSKKEGKKFATREEVETLLHKLTVSGEASGDCKVIKVK